MSATRTTRTEAQARAVLPTWPCVPAAKQGSATSGLPGESNHSRMWVPRFSHSDSMALKSLRLKVTSVASSEDGSGGMWGGVGVGRPAGGAPRMLHTNRMRRTLAVTSRVAASEEAAE